VRRRDPRLGQPALDQQLPHEARVEPIGLRAALGPTLGARLGRLGQVHLGADALQLFHDEPPARHRLHGRDQLDAVKAGEKPSERVAVGRAHAPRLHLARLDVKRVESDLRAMHVETQEDRHRCLQLGKIKEPDRPQRVGRQPSHAIFPGHAPDREPSSGGARPQAGRTRASSSSTRRSAAGVGLSPAEPDAEDLDDVRADRQQRVVAELAGGGSQCPPWRPRGPCR
jgi:hypothetical protein